MSIYPIALIKRRTMLIPPLLACCAVDRGLKNFPRFMSKHPKWGHLIREGNDAGDSWVQNGIGSEQSAALALCTACWGSALGLQFRPCAEAGSVCQPQSCTRSQIREDPHGHRSAQRDHCPQA